MHSDFRQLKYDSIDRKVQFVANLLKVHDKASGELKNLSSGLPFNYDDEAIQKLIKKSKDLQDAILYQEK